MGVIRELPKEVIGKIAAGEVIERPASVVKELIENAIDAKAKVVVIDVKNGGRSQIAVIDDGVGMEPADISLCVLRHATSKITNEADLWSVSTMGFRGEALAAVGAVSRLTIESRPNLPDVIEGARIEVEDGIVRGPVITGCPGGTKMVVTDLFYNVPARQKFLRSAAVEFGHIYDVVTGLSLSSPEIRFELIADGKRRFLSAGGDLKGRVGEVLGSEMANRLIPVDECSDGIRIKGWVTDRGRSGAKDIYFFLNRRPVRDKLLMHALTAAFGGGLGYREYPAAVLWFEVDPGFIDVNVHPTKREVRFANGGAVHDFAMAAIRKARGSCSYVSVTRNTATIDVQSGVARALDRFEQSRLSFEPKSRNWRPEARAQRSGVGEQKLHELQMPSHEPQVSNSMSCSSTFNSNLRVLGQLGSTYVACEGESGALILIDQHAAHERLGFDLLCQSYASGSVPRQVLLIPERIELGPRALAYVLEHKDAISRAGFEVEPFGGATLLVKEVPTLLGDAAVATLFDSLSSELENNGTSDSLDEEVNRIFAVIACHRQVRAGDKLSHEELSALVRDVEGKGIIHCPHGRPVTVRIEKDEIERWFRRK